MPPETPRDTQRRQFERALKNLRDLGPSIIDTAAYAEESYRASDRPDLELANAREYIASTLTSVAEGLASVASKLTENVRRESEEGLADTELLHAACTQSLQVLRLHAVQSSRAVQIEDTYSLGCSPECLGYPAGVSPTEDPAVVRASGSDEPEGREGAAQEAGNREAGAAAPSEGGYGSEPGARRRRGRRVPKGLSESAPSLEECFSRLAGPEAGGRRTMQQGQQGLRAPSTPGVDQGERSSGTPGAFLPETLGEGAGRGEGYGSAMHPAAASGYSSRGGMVTIPGLGAESGSAYSPGKSSVLDSRMGAVVGYGGGAVIGPGMDLGVTVGVSQAQGGLQTPTSGTGGQAGKRDEDMGAGGGGEGGSRGGRGEGGEGRGGKGNRRVSGETPSHSAASGSSTPFSAAGASSEASSTPLGAMGTPILERHGQGQRQGQGQGYALGQDHAQGYSKSHGYVQGQGSVQGQGQGQGAGQRHAQGQNWQSEELLMPVSAPRTPLDRPDDRLENAARQDAARVEGGSRKGGGARQEGVMRMDRLDGTTRQESMTMRAPRDRLDRLDDKLDNRFDSRLDGVTRQESMTMRTPRTTKSLRRGGPGREGGRGGIVKIPGLPDFSRSITGSSDDSASVLRSAAAAVRRDGRVPHAGDTVDGDPMEGVSGELSAHETSSYDTEEYYRGYDDEEESIQSSLTPGLDSANSYTSDKWQVVLTQSTNGRGTQAHASRTRKRDILKRAISKFKIGTHEQTAISTEDQG